MDDKKSGNLEKSRSGSRQRKRVTEEQTPEELNGCTLCNNANEKTVALMSSWQKLREQLQRSEAKYQSLLEGTGAGIVSIDVSGRFTTVNNALCTMIGYSKDEVLGRHFVDFIHPDEREAIQEKFMRALSDSPVEINIGFRAIHKDGRVVHMFSNPTLFKYNDHLFGFSAIIIDVSDLKRAETACEVSERKYQAIFENTGTAMAIVEEDTTLSLVNEEFAEIVGYSKDEVEGKMSWTKFALPEELPRLRGYHNMRRVDPNMAPESYETKLIDRFGDTVDIFLKVDLIKGTRRSVVSILDVTERNLMEKNFKRSCLKIGRILDGTVDALASAVELKDLYTAGHQKRVSRLSRAIARGMAMTKEQIMCLSTASAMHDVGKIQVPSEILNKPDKLTPIEFEFIKQHPDIGKSIVKKIEFPGPVADIIHQHHERIDGSGYPQGLVNDNILLEARVLAVADVVEAMMSHRPYRPALGIDKALNHIGNHSGVLYDPVVVEICMKVVGEMEHQLIKQD